MRLNVPGLGPPLAAELERDAALGHHGGHLLLGEIVERTGRQFLLRDDIWRSRGRRGDASAMLALGVEGDIVHRVEGDQEDVLHADVVLVDAVEAGLTLALKSGRPPAELGVLLERRRRGTRGRGQRRADDVAGVEIGSVARGGEEKRDARRKHRGARRSELGRTSCSTPSRPCAFERRKLHDGRACLRLPLLERRARATVTDTSAHLTSLINTRDPAVEPRDSARRHFSRRWRPRLTRASRGEKRPAVPCMVHDSSCPTPPQAAISATCSIFTRPIKPRARPVRYGHYSRRFPVKYFSIGVMLRIAKPGFTRPRRRFLVFPRCSAHLLLSTTRTPWS